MHKLRTVVIFFLSAGLGSCDQATPPDPSDSPPEICTCPVESDPRVEYIQKEQELCELAQWGCNQGIFSLGDIYPTECGCGCIESSYLDQAIEECGFADPRLEP